MLDEEVVREVRGVTAAPFHWHDAVLGGVHGSARFEEGHLLAHGALLHSPRAPGVAGRLHAFRHPEQGRLGHRRAAGRAAKEQVGPTDGGAGAGGSGPGWHRLGGVDGVHGRRALRRELEAEGHHPGGLQHLRPRRRRQGLACGLAGRLRVGRGQVCLEVRLAHSVPDFGEVRCSNSEPLHLGPLHGCYDGAHVLHTRRSVGRRVLSSRGLILRTPGCPLGRHISSQRRTTDAKDERNTEHGVAHSVWGLRTLCCRAAGQQVLGGARTAAHMCVWHCACVLSTSKWVRSRGSLPLGFWNPE
mmetsp:Transcript_60207/g.152835  ORF Transcript_60207/g.152835 Transcript_60207/m.152835 type:complete len:301 (+) Transcript_60207:811-1713(+)